MKERLKIRGWSKLRGELKGGYGIASVQHHYDIASVQHHTDYYRIELVHPAKPHMYFVIKREGYMSDGEWHYSTYIETDHKITNPGTVGINFLRNPLNLIDHINASIG